MMEDTFLCFFPLTHRWHHVQAFLVTLLQARRHMAPFLGGAEAKAGQAHTQNGSPEHWTAGLYKTHITIQGW